MAYKKWASVFFLITKTRGEYSKSVIFVEDEAEPLASDGTSSHRNAGDGTSVHLTSAGARNVSTLQRKLRKDKVNNRVAIHPDIM